MESRVADGTSLPAAPVAVAVAVSPASLPCQHVGEDGAAGRMPVEDALLVVAVAAFTACLSEGITYLLVYRSEEYQRLHAAVEKQTKKLEKMKEELTENKKDKKKLEKQEEQVKFIHQSMSAAKMRSMVVIALVFSSLLGIFNSIFEGHVVAKLPFHPHPWIQSLSHRTLEDDDPTSCSFIFLYVLSTLFMRQNLTKALGFGLSRAATQATQMNFGQPPA